MKKVPRLRQRVTITPQTYTEDAGAGQIAVPGTPYTRWATVSKRNLANLQMKNTQSIIEDTYEVLLNARTSKRVAAEDVITFSEGGETKEVTVKSIGQHSTYTQLVKLTCVINE